MARVDSTFSIRVVDTSTVTYDGTIDSLTKLVALPSAHWGVVPNSHILGVAGIEKLPADYPDFDGTASPSFQSYQGPAPGGAGGPHDLRSIMSAWSGGALDSSRSRLLIAGGGHSSYGGNEVYAFDVPSLQWLRLTNPFFVTSGIVPVANPNADGSPTSRHTYGGLGYCPTRDSFWMIGGAHWGANSGSSADLWELPFGALVPPAASPATWDQKNDAPSTLLGRTITWVPTLGRFIATGNSSPQWTKSYDPATDTWTDISGTGTGGGDLQGAVDDEMQILRIKYAGGLAELNIATGEMQRDVPQSGPFPGSNAYAFDTNSKRFVAFDGSATVYSTPRDSHGWTAHAPASGNLITPAPITASGGVYGRFQYVPAYDVFIYVNASNENVFFYRL